MTKKYLLGAAFVALLLALASCKKAPGDSTPTPTASPFTLKVDATEDTKVLSVKLGSPAPGMCEESTKPPCLEPYDGPQIIPGAKSFLVLLDTASAPDGLSTKAIVQVIDGNVEMLQVATSQSVKNVISIFQLLVMKWGEPHRSELNREWGVALLGANVNRELYKVRIWDFSNLQVTFEPFPDSPGLNKGRIAVETPLWQAAVEKTTPAKPISNSLKRF